MAQPEPLGIGTTAVVYALDNKRAVKKYFKPTDHEREVYTRIESHPNVIKYLGTQSDGSLILQRGKLLRLKEDRDRITYQMKLFWLRDAAEAMKHIHKKGVIHADIGCHNVVLVRDRLKIIDFEGCSLDNGPATSAYEWFSYREMEPPVSQQSDIFAYGCMVYEIIVGHVPFQEYEQKDDRFNIIAEHYAREQYPDVTGLPLSGLMKKCWSGELKSMSEVIHTMNVEVGLGTRIRLALRARMQKIQDRCHFFSPMCLA